MIGLFYYVEDASMEMLIQILENREICLHGPKKGDAKMFTFGEMGDVVDMFFFLLNEILLKSYRMSFYGY